MQPNSPFSQTGSNLGASGHSSVNLGSVSNLFFLTSPPPPAEPQQATQDSAVAHGFRTSGGFPLSYVSVTESLPRRSSQQGSLSTPQAFHALSMAAPAPAEYAYRPVPNVHNVSGISPASAIRGVAGYDAAAAKVATLSPEMSNSGGLLSQLVGPSPGAYAPSYAMQNVNQALTPTPAAAVPQYVLLQRAPQPEQHSLAYGQPVGATPYVAASPDANARPVLQQEATTSFAPADDNGGNSTNSRNVPPTLIQGALPGTSGFPQFYSAGYWDPSGALQPQPEPPLPQQLFYFFEHPTREAQFLHSASSQFPPCGVQPQQAQPQPRYVTVKISSVEHTVAHAPAHRTQSTPAYVAHAAVAAPTRSKSDGRLRSRAASETQVGSDGRMLGVRGFLPSKSLGRRDVPGSPVLTSYPPLALPMPDWGALPPAAAAKG